ncbi:alanine racemase [Patescibacteria group bacterium]|nr:alanine racemase [Patescibacteria group bacterium]
MEIHIFINTGMNREGLNEDELPAFLDLLEKNPQVKVTGVMSHLHSGDEIYYDQIDIQIEQFKKMYMEIINRGHAPHRRHIGNTA